MLYILKVYAVVAVFVFGLAGMLVLALAVWNQAKDYLRAQQAMRRIASPAVREDLAISRSSSRTHDPDLYKVA